jgi:chromosome segregation ATPase
MLITTLGLWGCTQSRSSGNSTAKLRDLEARNAKLEEDYRAAVADGTEAHKKLADAEEQVARLTPLAEQLQTVLRERDRLRKQVAATLTERNALHARMQEFSRDLQALAGRIDAAVGVTTTAAQPATTSTSLGKPGSL